MTGKSLFQQFYDAGAVGYDQLFGRVPHHFAASLMMAARLMPGQRVLDIATGTGSAAEAAAEAVGASGRVVAADISPAMLAIAKERLSNRPNVSCGIANGQDLPFPSGAFDAVICSLGLMLFPDPSQAMAEFRRVLRDDGRAAVAVETTAENSLTTRVNAAIGRHIPSRAAAAAVYYSLGEASLIRALFETAEFTDVEVFAEAQHFPFPSFNAYFQPIEQGAGSVGAEFLSLPPAMRRVVREDVRCGLEGMTDADGAMEVPVTILFGSGQK